jgi:hypothetical protein
MQGFNPDDDPWRRGIYRTNAQRLSLSLPPPVAQSLLFRIQADLASTGQDSEVESGSEVRILLYFPNIIQLLVRISARGPGRIAQCKCTDGIVKPCEHEWSASSSTSLQQASGGPSVHYISSLVDKCLQPGFMESQLFLSVTHG